MQQCIEQYHTRGGGLTLPLRIDVQGWHKGNVTITEVLTTPVPAMFEKMLHSKTHLATIA